MVAVPLGHTFEKHSTPLEKEVFRDSLRPAEATCCPIHPQGVEQFHPHPGRPFNRLPVDAEEVRETVFRRDAAPPKMLRYDGQPHPCALPVDVPYSPVTLNLSDYWNEKCCLTFARLV